MTLYPASHEWLTLCRKHCSPQGSLRGDDCEGQGVGEGGPGYQPWEKQSYLKQRRQNSVWYEFSASVLDKGFMLRLIKEDDIRNDYKYTRAVKRVNLANQGKGRQNKKSLIHTLWLSYGGGGVASFAGLPSFFLSLFLQFLPYFILLTVWQRTEKGEAAKEARGGVIWCITEVLFYREDIKVDRGMYNTHYVIIIWGDHLDTSPPTSLLYGGTTLTPLLHHDHRESFHHSSWSVLL